MISITHEDNMDLMSRYPDKFFDLAIVDPPYGIGAEKGSKWSRRRLDTGKKWDIREPDSYFNELFRVSRNQIIWGGTYYHLPICKGWICWYKTVEVQNRSFSEFELAWTSFDRVARHYTEKPFIGKGQRIHPTQKPVKLYKWLLTQYAQPGWKILDTHLGSGSIALACMDLGFDLTACELDTDYYQAARERISLYQKQLSLFPAGKQGSSATQPVLI